MTIFLEPNIFKKLESVEIELDRASVGITYEIPRQPARDASVLSPDQHPAKLGLSKVEGQARLLHDLANIELQALELSLRTWVEFYDDLKYLNELDNYRQLILSEAEHCRLCLDEIHRLGFSWGQWPVHLALWNAVSKHDTILDRVFIVHRYLEGSGLDAGETLLRRLNGLHNTELKKLTRKIHSDEVDHVVLGGKIFEKISDGTNFSSDTLFRLCLERLHSRLPQRFEPINNKIRLQSGFSTNQIQTLEQYRYRRMGLGK